MPQFLQLHRKPRKFHEDIDSVVEEAESFRFVRNFTSGGSAMHPVDDFWYCRNESFTLINYDDVLLKLFQELDGMNPRAHQIAGDTWAPRDLLE
jgi:hypothetical protein